MLAPESFTADKKVQKAVAETNSNIQTFTQIADEWKPLAEDIISRYPLEKSTGKVSFKGVGAYYKNFSEIRQALNDVLYFTYQFEKYQKEFAAALAEMDKEKTLMLHGEMQKNLDSLQEYVLHASRVPGMNDFIAEHLEGQRSA